MPAILVVATQHKSQNDQMKVLHVISTLSDNYGGPVFVLKALSRLQAQSGLDVTICTTNTDYPTGVISEQTNELTRVHGVNVIYHAALGPLLHSFSMWRWLNKQIPSFDIVHIHGLYRHPVSVAARLARKHGVPYIIRTQGSLDPFIYAQSKKSLWLKRLHERCFDFPNLNKASALHFTTEEEQTLVSRLNFKSPGVVIPNGLDWGVYETLPDRGAFRRFLGIGETDPLILFLGRLNFKKGLDHLIPAFALVKEKLPKARLALVGPDNDGFARQIESWCADYGVEDSVTFVDFLQQDAKKEAFVDADVFAPTSYAENFGVTVAESMACGTPVVISDRVNLWREVSSAGAGLVPALEKIAIAEALLKIIQDNEFAKEMGKRGRLLAQQKFAWQVILSDLEATYRRLI